MPVRFISCEACGCVAKAGNMFIPGKSAEAVFEHLGHDPYTGNMHYRCPSCASFLLVDPMKMLDSTVAMGVLHRIKRSNRRQISADIINSFKQYFTREDLPWKRINWAGK